MYAARRTGTREERPTAWALGGRPRPGSLQNPCAASFSHSLVVGRRGSFVEGPPRSVARISCRLLPADPESKASVGPAPPPPRRLEVGLREGRSVGLGPGMPGLARGFSAENSETGAGERTRGRGGSRVSGEARAGDIFSGSESSSRVSFSMGIFQGSCWTSLGT